MKRSRVVAAASASLFGFALVATPASAQEPVSVELHSNEVGDVNFTATGGGCLPADGDRVTVRVVPADGEGFVNGVFGIPDEAGAWSATGSVAIAEAGLYQVRAFCHFGEFPPEGTAPIGGSGNFEIVEPDPGEEPPGEEPPGEEPPGEEPPGEEPPGGPGDGEDPPGPGDPGTEPGVDDPENGNGDDSENGNGDNGEDGEDGTAEATATAASTTPTPAGAPAAVNGEPELTG